MKNLLNFIPLLLLSAISLSNVKEFVEILSYIIVTIVSTLIMIHKMMKEEFDVSKIENEIKEDEEDETEHWTFFKISWK